MQVDDQFLKDMGFDDLEGEEKQKVLEDLLYTLNWNVGKRVAEQLPEDKAEEFDHLVEGKPGEQELADWLERNVPNYEQLIEEEATKLRDNLDNLTDKVMGAKGD